MNAEIQCGFAYKHSFPFIKKKEKKTAEWLILLREYDETEQSNYGKNCATLKIEF